MSRLYGRAFDVYQISNYLNGKKIPKYNEDNSKISIDELIDSSAILDLYLPQSAIDFILEYPIHIVKSPFIPRNMSSFPTKENPNATIFFKGMNFKKEQKRELNFFLGSVLSNINPDELPKKDNIPCEYGDILPLLLEYLYLKETNQEDRFLLKHLNSLKYKASNYSKLYEKYHRFLATNNWNELDYMTQEQLDRIEDNNKRMENEFLKNTLTMLVPFSSVDGLLQILDKIKTKEELKELINVLYENKNNDRQEILKEYDVSSYGYKRLRKEIDEWGCKR